MVQECMLSFQHQVIMELTFSISRIKTDDRNESENKKFKI